MKRERLSNNDKATDYVNRMKRFVDDAMTAKLQVPMKHGRVNTSAVAANLGFPRERFYSNDLLAAELERLRAFLNEQPNTTVAPGTPKEVKALIMRIQGLEKALLLKSIELESMRDLHLRREQAEEHLLRTGRIIQPFQRDGLANRQAGQ